MISSIQMCRFQSWTRFLYHFNKGVTLATGRNLDDNTGEGAGKSAIFNGITWCLWGKLPKDTNIDDVVQIGSDGPTEVTLYTDSGYRITRTRNPNDLYFMLPNAEIYPTDCVRGKDMKETQKMINEIVGMSFETFCQSIYFPQNYEKKFITSNEEEKAKILSEIQDLTVFDRASKKANENARTQSTELEKIKLNILADEQLYTSLKGQLETLEGLERRFTVQKELDLAELQKRIDKVANDIQTTQQGMSDIGTMEDLKKLNEAKTQVNNELQKISNKLYSIDRLKEQAKSKDCPTCKRPLDNQTHIEIPDSSDLLAAQKDLESQRLAITKEVEAVHLKKERFNQLVFQMGLLTTEHKRYIRDLDKLQKSSNDYEEKIYLILEQLNTLTSSLSALKSNADATSRSVTRLLFLKDGFKEIKSHVFQGLLNDLNGKSNYYLREFFDIPCSIKFTNISSEGELSKIQTKVTLNNNEYTLGLLSGGQMRRVQLAVDFAISEIIAARSNQSINMRILDEPFKDLSEEKMIKILEFLKKMPGKTIIIEHSPAIKSFVDREIRIELKDGISRLTSD